MQPYDTCRYVCLLAAQLRMNNYTPTAHLCNVCADVTPSDPEVGSVHSLDVLVSTHDRFSAPATGPYKNVSNGPR
ncbi:unnamed protein product [Sphagnum balticum]